MYMRRCLKKVYDALLLLNKSLSLEERKETSFLQNIWIMRSAWDCTLKIPFRQFRYLGWRVIKPLTENLEEQCCMRLCARIISRTLQLCSLLTAKRKKLCCAWLKVWADLCDMGALLAWYMKASLLLMNFLLLCKRFDVFWVGLQSALWQFQCPVSRDKLRWLAVES